jgi:hypothetical protein
MAVPEIPDGSGFTVTVAMMAQPAGGVYVITAVPVVMPVTMPLPPTLAVPGALLLQVPPVMASLNEVVNPTQTFLLPAIGDSTASTVNTAVVWQPVVVNL